MYSKQASSLTEEKKEKKREENKKIIASGLVGSAQIEGKKIRKDKKRRVQTAGPELF